MADDNALVDRMQSAFSRAQGVIKNAMFNSLAETVDQPWDGTALTGAEKRDWTMRHRDNPTLLGGLQAELGKKYHLTEQKPFARRLVVRMKAGLADLKREGE